MSCWLGCFFQKEPWLKFWSCPKLFTSSYSLPFLNPKQNKIRGSNALFSIKRGSNADVKKMRRNRGKHTYKKRTSSVIITTKRSQKHLRNSATSTNVRLEKLDCQSMVRLLRSLKILGTVDYINILHNSMNLKYNSLHKSRNKMGHISPWLVPHSYFHWIVNWAIIHIMTSFLFLDV